MRIDLIICLVRKPRKDPTGIQTHSPGAAEEETKDSVDDSASFLNCVYNGSPSKIVSRLGKKEEMIERNGLVAQRAI